MDSVIAIMKIRTSRYCSHFASLLRMISGFVTSPSPLECFSLDSEIWQEIIVHAQRLGKKIVWFKVFVFVYHLIVFYYFEAQYNVFDIKEHKVHVTKACPG